MVAMATAQDVVIEKESGVYVGARLGIYNIKSKSDVDMTVTATGNGSILARDTGTEEITGNVPGGALFVGYKLSPQFRIEAEVSTFSADYTVSWSSTKGTVTTTMLKALGYWDIPLENTPIKPYLVVGLGNVNYEDKLGGWSLTTSGLSFDLGVGCGYTLTENLTLDASVRYMTAKMADVTEQENLGNWGPPFGNVIYQETWKVTLTSLAVNVGIRYIF